MQDAQEVRALIAKEVAGDYGPVKAEIFRRRWHTASQPVLLDAADGGQYVAKGSQNGRMLYSEYVCGRLGHLIGAPTVKLAFVDVTELRQSEPQMSHFGPGLALGSVFVADASDRIDGIQNLDHGDNRRRFASLAILYAWARGGDCQFIYHKNAPMLVYSNDHGHFFPGQNAWTKASLDADVAPVTAHPHFAGCGFKAADVAEFETAVSQMTDQEIRDITRAPPTWVVTPAERDAVFDYLTRRRAGVAGLYPP